MAFLLQQLPDDDTLKRYAATFPEMDPTATLAYLRLLRVGSELLAALDEFLGGFGMTHGRWLTLVVLHRSGGTLLPHELATQQGVSRATMTGLLAKLDAEGLIRREASATDARCSAAALTPKGAAFVEEVLPRVYGFIKQQMRPLDAEQQTTLMHLLGHFLTDDGGRPHVREG